MHKWACLCSSFSFWSLVDYHITLIIFSNESMEGKDKCSTCHWLEKDDVTHSFLSSTTLPSETPHPRPTVTHSVVFALWSKNIYTTKCMALFLMTLWEISLSKIGLFSNGTNTVASSHRGKKKEEDFLFFNQKERFLKAFFQMQNGHRKLLLYVFLQVWNGLADAFIVETWGLDFKKLFRPFLLFT